MSDVDLRAMDMGAKWSGSNMSNIEVFMVGEAIMNWIAAVARLGHSSPASTLDYTTNPGLLGIGGLIVRDFVAWTAGQDEKVPGCEERLRQLCEAGALESAALKTVSEALAASSP